MDAKQLAIYTILQENPDTFHITADGSEIYILVPNEGLIVLTPVDGGNWLGHSAEELQQYVHDWILSNLS